MNAVWGFLDWFWPPSAHAHTSARRPIRLSDDLDDPLHRRHSTAAAPPALPRSRSRRHSEAPPPPPRVAHTQVQTRQPSPAPDGGIVRDLARARDDYRRQNVRLLDKVVALERELDGARKSLHAAKQALLDQSARAAAFQSKAATLEQRLLDAHEEIQARQGNVDRLQAENETLATAREDTLRTLQDTAVEVQTLQSYLTKTDAWTGAEIVQAIGDLNAEIVQLAASVADEFASSLDRSQDLARSSDSDLISSALGPTLRDLLATRDHAADPMLVALALQAWEVHCCHQVFSAFCFGLPGDVDRLLNDLFARMLEREPQSVACRWRALTHAHTHALLSDSLASPPTPLPVPSPAHLLDAGTLVQIHARGLRAVLVLAGAAAQREPLARRFAPALAQIVARTFGVARVLREGVMSRCFEVVRGPREAEGRRYERAGMCDVLGVAEARAEGEADADGVLCGVEFGLVCLKGRGAEGEGEAKVNGVEKPGEEGVVERKVLLKPKVLLRSVVEALDS